MARARAFPIAALAAAGIVAAAFAPIANASEDGPVPCSKDPVLIILAIVENAALIVDYAAERGAAALSEFAMKGKCSALELVGICSDDDSLIQVTTQSTGHAHPHRGFCYEYVFVPGANAPDRSSCPAGKKVQHDERFGADVHSCVDIQKLNN